MHIDSRVFQLYDLADSSSDLTLEEILRVGLGHIVSNPLLGVVGEHIAYTGRNGGFIHEILSVWPGFVFPAFFLFLYFQLAANFRSFVLLR